MRPVKNGMRDGDFITENEKRDGDFITIILHKHPNILLLHTEVRGGSTIRHNVVVATPDYYPFFFFIY